MYDLNASSESVLGEHKGAIRCVEFAGEVNAVLTGSWDGTVKMWDSRVPNCVGTYNQGNERVSFFLKGIRFAEERDRFTNVIFFVFHKMALYNWRLALNFPCPQLN